jgi:hypothetical protein
MNDLTSLFTSVNINSDLNVILGVFLLTLAVSGNFIAESLSCKMRTLLSENMYAKNFVILLIIYFSLGLVSEKSVIPTDHFKNTFIIWILFLGFNKMNISFTIVTFFLLFSVLICKNWIDYYDETDREKNKEQIDNLGHISKYLLLSIIITIIIGFLFYFRKQYSEHHKHFNFFTFLFGKVKCDSS